MNSSRICRWTCGLFLGALAGALAQPGPNIGYVYPAGGRQGTTFEVAIGGQSLATNSKVFVSADGVQGVAVNFYRPMPQGEFNRLRDKLRELQEKKQEASRANRGRNQAQDSTNVWTAADEKMLTEARDRILKNPPNRNATPAIADVITAKITIAPDAESGPREIRVETANGLSNPLRFHVGQLPEVSRPPAKSPNPDMDRFLERLGRTPPKPAPTEMRVTLPAVVNGQIMPGAVDRFRFSARQGQELVAVVNARELIPYLADAVPGWFQATLAIYDSKGKELAYADDFRFDPDPVLHYRIPRDGEYVVEIKDSIYRGREDFVYRITLGEVPLITSIFPPSGKAGVPTTLELTGWNLPESKLKFEAAEPGIHWISLSKDDRISNRVPFLIDDLPEQMDKEPNDTAQRAQTIKLPVSINGQIAQPRDTDVFRFDGRAGDEIVAEIHARRLGSPLDSVLKLVDSNGRQLAFNDDTEDKGSGLNTHHADSYLRARLPASGTYFLHVGDAQNRGGSEYTYRLRVSEPRPDFELRLVPSSITVRGGTSVPLTVYALRKDGFDGAIQLAFKDAPQDFALNGGRIPPGQDQLRFTITAPPRASEEPFTLAIEGRATAAERQLVRLAVPADDLMQAFFYRHLVPADALKATVTGRFMARTSTRVLGDSPVKIPAGGTASVRVAAGVVAADRIQLELSDPPAGVSIQRVAPSRDGAEIVLRCDASKVSPGFQGNLIVQAFSDRTAPGARPQTNQRRTPLGTLPAIPFEIVD